LQSEVREFEPRLAVTDEQDGMRHLRRIAQIAEDHLLGGGALLVEIAYNQETPACQVMAESGRWDVEVVKDYAGLPRVVMARFTP
jgi:release factor glutamine methyltransferase